MQDSNINVLCWITYIILSQRHYGSVPFFNKKNFNKINFLIKKILIELVTLFLATIDIYSIAKIIDLKGAISC